MRSLVIFVSAWSLCALAQDAPKKGPDPFAEPKNLKVFQSLTGAQLRDAMLSFRVALGVQCTHCHVQGDFASETNPKKEVARNMILMAREINGHFPADGNMRVRCYTCHRGALKPLTAPPPAEPAK